MSTRIYRGALLATTTFATVTIAAPAMAQVSTDDQTNQENSVQIADPAARVAEETADQANPQVEDVVITGSRIVRRDLESASPVAVIQDEEFKLSGSTNVEQVVNTLPQAIPGTTSFSNNPGGGVSTLNLRGLGSSRTLVLVNNRRWVSFDTAQVVDTNTIPAFLIDSVDVVTGGASAVYGSDAVAGVVNFRLRKDLRGLEVGGTYAVTGQGDGARYNVYAALGTAFDDDRGHATVYGEYYNRASVYQGGRDFSRNVIADDYEGGTYFGGSPTTPNGRVLATYPAASCPVGNIFCSPGAYYAQPGVSRPFTTDDYYNFGPANYLQVPAERYLLGGYADYEVGGGHTAYGEVTFVNNRVANELAATPVTGTFNVDIASVSPFLSATDIAQLTALDAIAAGRNVVGDGIVPLSISRRVIESGGRNQLDERNAFRALIGIQGPVGYGFNYDLYYSYARTRNAQVQAGNISRSAFQRGLDGTDPAINIFGPNTLTPEMVDQISILAQNGDTSVLQVLSGSISGSLFNFGWGGDDVGLAIGAEYRKMASEFIPDTALSSGDVIGFNAGDPTAGDYNVKEIFGELRVPVVARSPFAYLLELNGAARYSDYSLEAVGGVWTYAGGVQYAPVRDITFRAQYQHAIRAPNVAELFGGQAVGFPGATDPCAFPSDQTDRALCLATGVPAGAYGSGRTLQPATQIQGVFGGNPLLQEETSDTFTAGVVLRPSFLPGFSATVDYYNIEVEGYISTLGGGLSNTLNLCYNVIRDINSPYCQAVVGTRDALGVIGGDAVFPAILNANTGKLRARGVDFQVDYGMKVPFRIVGQGESKLNFSFLGTRTLKNTLTPVADLPDDINECAGRFGQLACGNPTPKWKWTSRLSLVGGPLTVSTRWRHLSKVTDDDPDTDYFYETLKSYNLFDLSASFDATERLSFTAGVNNIFDKKPPLAGDNQEQANTYPGTYDVLGRDFFVGAKFKF